MSNLKKYMLSQFVQIKERPVIVVRKILMLISFLIAIPIVIISRLVCCIVLIRFGQVRTQRMGPFATGPELFLCKEEKEQGKKHKIDILCAGWGENSVCNEQLLKMWARVLPIYEFGKILFRANKMIPGHEKHTVELINEWDLSGALRTNPPHVKFIDKELEEGARFLEKVGIGSKNEFVCIAERTSAYLNSWKKGDWSYHNYRDFDLEDLMLSSEMLAQKGLHVLRMGAKVDKRLDSEHQNIIDYANKYRTDFLDIYLLSKCLFYLGSHSGINSIPMLFRRPRAIVNILPAHTFHTWMPNDIFIPKKLWDKKEKRMLSFEEMLEPDVGWFMRSNEYEERGLEIINNTPEDILDLTNEMYSRLKGTWKEEEEDATLQADFWKIFKSSTEKETVVGPRGELVSRMGASFLRKNKNLL